MFFRYFILVKIAWQKVSFLDLMIYKRIKQKRKFFENEKNAKSFI